jgi:hypothetical protein
MIYSGLDWSEDVGGPLGYIAMVHVDESDWLKLENELATARIRLGRGSNYVFKHVDAKPRVHDQFYMAIANVSSLQAHVYRYDRSNWSLQHAKAACGDPCICDAFITLTLRCPRGVVENQTLYIDLPRRERDIVVAFATALRHSVGGARQRSFRHIKPRPDDRLEGGIVQVADMIAGEVREQSGIGGPYLPRLGSRIRIV